MSNEDMWREIASKYKKALERIADPVRFLQEKAEREGRVLDGMMAYQLTNDPRYLRNIAKEVLREVREGE